MYVRWKKRQAKKGITYAAYLVYSVRAFGVPQQRVLAYLGCITHCGKNASGAEWHYSHASQGEDPWPVFLSDLKKKLQREVKEKELPRLYQQLYAVVPEDYHAFLSASDTGEK